MAGVCFWVQLRPSSAVGCVCAGWGEKELPKTTPAKPKRGRG